MPVYNATPYLEECLDSILAQSVDDWELYAVNDFSTDDSAVILEAYAKKDSRIQWHNNTDKGIIPALRLAFSKSNGDYITRMDADDKMPEDKLETMLALLENKGELATGKVEYFPKETIAGGYARYAQWLNDLTAQGRNFDAIYKECVIPSPAWMLHRDDLVACGAFESDIYPEDYELVFRFYKYGLLLKTTNKIVHYWRDHQTRASRNDPNYANQQYFDLKMPQFLELDHDDKRPLVLWGAGKKGKRLAEMLHQRSQAFRWLCNTPSKWGHTLWGQSFEPTEVLSGIENPQVIVSVANPEEQAEIVRTLHQKGLTCEGKDYFLFC